MKKLFFFANFKLICLVVIYLFLAGTVKSNWIKSNYDANGNYDNYNDYDVYDKKVNKEDSLPAGVTKEWLNTLTDENGQKIMQGEDPEGDALQRKIFNGQNSGDRFGYSVSSAGDVNGDGFSDVIVGTPTYSSNTGRAYIYFGGLNMNSIADVTITGETTNNYFGASVSSAGDVNVDGYTDVIVGAYGYSTNTGRAYIYFGGASMNNTADVTFTGESTNNFFGVSVSSAGDVDGDGYSDVIVGAYGYLINTGNAYLYFGGASMNNTADVTFTGETTANYFGFSVSLAGDVNGDGYSDVIVSAYRFSTQTGRAYLYFGGASMNNVADLTMTGESTNNFFGRSVSSAGDVNGDGYSDVIVGADGYSTNTGRAYLYFGGASMNNTADVTYTGETTSNDFGYSVSSAGDVNSDGYSDVIVGAYGYSSDIGRTYVFFGGASMNNTADVTMTGETTNNFFGISVSSAGDVNGDGYSDMIVGASGYSSSTGRVYLYDYLMKNEIIQDVTFTGEAIDNSFGVSVSSAGDVNGDGYSDVIVGASQYPSNTGKAYIYFGGTSINNTADVTMTGETIGNSFGVSVSSAGDVNGDGYSDVIISASRYSTNTGRAYIYFGGASMNNTADVIMTGETISNSFGVSVSSAGDVNGDGYSDVIVGAWGYSSNTGRAYIYFGGASMNNTADVTMTGETTSIFFGLSVSSAGDVNGDGYSEVIVGANGYSSNTGRAYLYFGGESMNNVADVTITGEATGIYFGTNVSSAGDVNGDGYSEVIVGAFGYSTYTGRAFIYFGGASMNNVADVTMTGEAIDNYFGSNVSTAGDVNGDGYSDVIISSYRYSSNTGRAYVYFGGASMNNIADVTMTGETAGNDFGSSVSSAGDVNGDGYSDLIIGADNYSSSTGRAYMYLGSAISVKPILINANDVPNDQGGFLNLKFAKSSFDVLLGEAGGISYQIDRSVPPNINGYQWISVANISGTYNSNYTAEIHTPYDSGTSGNNTYFFRVTAVSNSTGNFWRSNILSGYSLDNIAPPAVSPFTAVSSGANVNLNWGSNSAPDLLNYVLFRSVNPTIDPYTATPLSTITTTTYLDTSPLSGLYYYFIVAQDIHGNYSPVAVTESPIITLNMTMFIEGFYNSVTDIQVSDTIKVYLRNTITPFAKVDSAKTVVSSNGNAPLIFGNAPSGQYYIVTTHRNSIETWSKSGGESLARGSSVNYNFSSSSSQAFGDNMKQVDATPLRYAIYSGDENQDGFINLTDVIGVYNAASSFVNGYVISDMNGDNLTDLTDVIITNNNANLFVSVLRP